MSESIDNKRPITADGDRPQKKYYRQRAHCNPLSHNDSFAYPPTPLEMNWSEHFANAQAATILDVGCGFGGLTMALATLFPNQNVLGMEIRAKVAEYVRLRIVAAQSSSANTHNNASVMRTNSMKYLPNYVLPASVEKLFFCFPDPHFKKKNHARRIVEIRLLAQYAFVLKDGGRLYCITDVKELHEWHVQMLNEAALFRAVECGENDDASEDPCVAAMKDATEEGQKVTRNKGDKYWAVYERIPNSEAVSVTASTFFGNGGVLRSE
jgi:tRNA (guanine-N7-)-methyltransferase